MIKSQKTKNRREFPQLHKQHLQKNPIANIILKGEKTACFAPKMRNKKEYPFLPLLFNIVLEVLVSTKRQEKGIKKKHTRKKKQLPIFI